MKELNTLKVGSPSSHKKSATVLGLPPPSTWDYPEENDEANSSENEYEYEDEKEQEYARDGYRRARRDDNTIVEHDVPDYEAPKDLYDIEEYYDNEEDIPPEPTVFSKKPYGHSEADLNKVPPPLPTHIRQQFEKSGDNHGNSRRNRHHRNRNKRHNIKNKPQRSATSPVGSPIASISPLSPPEDIMSPVDEDVSVFPKPPPKPPTPPKYPPRVPKNNNSVSGSKVSDIIARFNYINVAVTSPVTDEDYVE